MGGSTSSTPRGGRRRVGMITSINITPMVDVVLVLCIILMVSSTYIVSQTLKVELPRSKTSDGAAEAPTTLTLLREGGARWNQQLTRDEDVPALMREAVGAAPDLSLVISADRQVPHGRVVHFIDLARQHGIRRFAINVENRD